jgi:uncharacterized protein YpmB
MDDKPKKSNYVTFELVVMVVMFACVWYAFFSFKTPQPEQSTDICVKKMWHTDYRVSSDYYITSQDKVYQVVNASVWGLMEEEKCYEVLISGDNQIYRIKAYK